MPSDEEFVAALKTHYVQIVKLQSESLAMEMLLAGLFRKVRAVLPEKELEQVFDHALDVATAMSLQGTMQPHPAVLATKKIEELREHVFNGKQAQLQK